MDEADIKAQVERLEAVRADEDLLKLFPPVVAAGFGAIPLARRGPTLEVAFARSVNPAAVTALGRALGVRVEPWLAEDAVLQAYLSRLYLRGTSVNFNTFLDEGFLARPDALPLLLVEKDGEPVKPHVRADHGRLVLLDMAYRSVLEDLDGTPPPSPYEAGDTERPFDLDRDGDGAMLHRPEDPPRDVLLLISESYCYEGCEHRRGWRAHDVRELPHLVHPSEVQICGLESDGTLHFYVYDRVERVRPGQSPRFDLRYHFLSFGHRYRRSIAVRVYALRPVKRADLRRAAEALPWTVEHLARYLGHDLA